MILRNIAKSNIKPFSLTHSHERKILWTVSAIIIITLQVKYTLIIHTDKHHELRNSPAHLVAAQNHGMIGTVGYIWTYFMLEWAAMGKSDSDTCI